jgi:MFS family permease
MPLYLQRSFTANYRMVTLIPVVFGVGKWVASLPSGYLMDRLGRRSLMTFGLLLVAAIDVLSIATADYRVFLALRAVGGAGWAMFATVATTITVAVRASERRGRAVSLLLMSETLGLLLGSTAGGCCIRGSESRAPSSSKPPVCSWRLALLRGRCSQQRSSYHLGPTIPTTCTLSRRCCALLGWP